MSSQLCPTSPDVARYCPTHIMVISDDEICSIAEDNWESRLTKSAQWEFKEMALVKISVCVFAGREGNTIVVM